MWSECSAKIQRNKLWLICSFDEWVNDSPLETEGEKTPTVWIVILEFLWMKIASEWLIARLRCVRVCVGVCLGVFDTVNDFINCKRLARIRCAHPELKRILKWNEIARSAQNRHSRGCTTLMTKCSCVVVVVFPCRKLTKWEWFWKKRSIP